MRFLKLGNTGFKQCVTWYSLVKSGAPYSSLYIFTTYYDLTLIEEGGVKTFFLDFWVILFICQGIGN